MVWNISGPQGYESAKIASVAVPYLQGKGLDIGCGKDKVWPSAIGIDSCKDYQNQKLPSIDIVTESSDLSMFADRSMDYLFSSHNLEHIVDYKAALKEWWRVIKPKGYLVLYIPHKHFYPNIGQPGANPDHKHDFLPDDIINAMKEVGSWELLENQERDKHEEYSFFQVYRKKEGKNRHVYNLWKRNPEGLKRALIIRYGAIGDQILASSILPALKKQGYYITYQTTPDGQEVLKHDPHIDEWWIQAKDYVPNQALGPYWHALRLEDRWDKTINLCESVEGALLTLPDRLTHFYPTESRKKMFSTINYMERTHDIADVPHDFKPTFYPTKEEDDWAKKERNLIKAPIVAWCVNGSSHHKVYPYVETVVSYLLKHTPCHVFLMGDNSVGKELQTGIVEALKKNEVDMKNLHPICGQWKIRQALSFIRHVDCIVGPETGPMNAVCMEENPIKVIYLSHSSPENLTKHWKNTMVISPSQKDCPCFPCNRLHYNTDHCTMEKVSEKAFAAKCTTSIPPKFIFERIVEAMKIIHNGKRVA